MRLLQKLVVVGVAAVVAFASSTAGAGVFPATPFVDVPVGRFYSDPVAWMVEQNITTGTSPTTFSPDDPVTRGQVAAFFWRYAGEPTPTTRTTPFVDVPLGRFYSDPVAWMVEQNITTGTSPTTFSPDDPVTRGQVAAFFWRYAGEPGPETQSLCVINGSNVVSVASATECAALEALYDATGGADWDFNDGWKTATDPCSWYSVTCDTNGITELNLAINGLSGPIPASLGNLTNLTNLALHGNDLSGPIPASLGNLTNLTFLRLYNNDLSGSIPAELGNLANLALLDVENNRLSGDLTAAMNGLKDTLTSLSLSDGSGGNDCFSTTDPALVTWLNGIDAFWAECDPV